MNIGGGITFLTHILIIIVHWIIKKPIHFIIILLVFIFYFSQFILLSKTSYTDNNVKYIYNYVTGNKYVIDDILSSNKDLKCNNNNNLIDPSKKYVILMLDDLQTLYLRSISLKIINEAISRKIPFTLGVIPLSVKYDSPLISFLKQNKCELELAQYGFNNRDDVPEFKDLPEFLAEYKLQEGLKILSDLTDRKITTFIAPDNLYSEGTIKAARNKYFKIISGNGNGFFDYNEYLNEKSDSVDLVVNDSIKNANIKGFSIIMIHTKDYVDQYGEIDPNKYSKYLKLLNKLEHNGFSFTTMSDYYSYLSKQNMETDFFDKSVLMPTYKNKNVINDLIEKN